MNECKVFLNTNPQLIEKCLTLKKIREKLENETREVLIARIFILLAQFSFETLKEYAN